MAFAPHVKEDMLVASSRRCCLCHRFCGKKVECAHIEQDGGDEFDNGIPLCFDCHEEAFSYDPDHPKGNKFTAAELKRHRDDWYAKVAHYPTSEMQEEHRQADIRSFMQVYRRLPSGWFLSHLDGLVSNGFEEHFSHEQRWAYSYYMNATHFQFFSLDVASAVADFNAEFERLMDVLACQHHVHPNKLHYYRPYSGMSHNFTREQYDRAYEDDMNRTAEACRTVRVAYLTMLDAVAAALPEVVPLDPAPVDAIEAEA